VKNLDLTILTTPKIKGLLGRGLTKDSIFTYVVVAAQQQRLIAGQEKTA
jgi:hypothetical protein